MRLKYFAYGSNIDAERMRQRDVAFYSRVLGTLPGYQLKFNKVASGKPGQGYANIVPNAQDLVEGALYEIKATDLRKLDFAESYPCHYLKIPIFIQISDNQATCAITYVAHPEKVKDGLKPTKEYLKHLLAGKDILSPEYLKTLQQIQTFD